MAAKPNPATDKQLLDHMSVYHMPLPPRVNSIDWLREIHDTDHDEDATMRIDHTHEEE